MNVVIFCDTYVPEINGVATSIFYLHQTLVEHGHKCLVVTTNSYTDKVMVDGDAIRIPGIRLKRLYGYTIARFYNDKVFEMVRDFKPDLIHLNHDGPIGQFGSICASRLNVATCYTFHTMYEDYSYYVTKGHFDRLARAIIQAYTRLKLNTNNESIAPSLKSKEYLRSAGNDGYINVMPTGIDFRVFDRKKEDKEATAKLKKELGIDPDDFVLLSLGRVAKEKSIDVCQRGFAAYLKAHPEAKMKMVIVGSGPDINFYKDLASSLGVADKTVFVGAVPPDQTYKYYWLGDCFVSASLSETQGLTFMEAMASSLRVMARYDDNLAGTIIDGKSGFFFYDEDDFVPVLDKVYKQSETDKKKMIEESLKAIEPYSLEAFYNNAMRIYERAIRKSW